MTSFVDRVRSWNRHRIALHRTRRGVRPTVFGFAMNGTSDMVNGDFEPEETALVRTLLARSDRFANVGANTGYYCLLARQANLPVIALEPIPTTVSILLENLCANGFDSGTMVLPVAAGPAAGSAQIFGVGTGASMLRGWANNPENLTQIVPVVKLDDVVRPPEKSERLLILMDVEGFEFAALQGAMALLYSDPKPVWVIEIALDGAGTATSADVQATFDLMAKAGYTARCATAGMELVSAPLREVTNYIFHAKGLSELDLMGPVEERVPIYRA